MNKCNVKIAVGKALGPALVAAIVWRRGRLEAFAYSFLAWPAAALLFLGLCCTGDRDARKAVREKLRLLRAANAAAAASNDGGGGGRGGGKVKWAPPAATSKSNSNSSRKLKKPAKTSRGTWNSYEALDMEEGGLRGVRGGEEGAEVT